MTCPLKAPKTVSCLGFVFIMSVHICPVGQCSMVISSQSTLSLMRKYFTLMCLVRVIINHVTKASVNYCFRNCWNCCNCRYRKNWRNSSWIHHNGCNRRYCRNFWDNRFSSCCSFGCNPIDFRNDLGDRSTSESLEEPS